MGKIMTKVGIRHVYSLGNTVRSSLAASHPSLLHLGPPLHSVTYYVRDPKLLFVALTFLRTWLLTLTLQTQFVAFSLAQNFSSTHPGHHSQRASF